MQGKNKKLIIFGDSAFAEIAYEYFTHDSEFEIVGFTVDDAYLKRNRLFGLPIVAFEHIQKVFPPDKYQMHIALVYNKMNRIRKQKYIQAKSKGYTLASYVSTKAFLWQNVTLGDNVFIFEDNTIQPFVKLGSNLVLWSGNHIGHHSTVGDHCFISSHVVISGFCNIGDACFLGVNSTIANNINIGNDCLIGAASLIVRDLDHGSLVKGHRTMPSERSTYDKFNIDGVE